ncbi:phage/plasmid replication domain-containing protein [Oceanobacillus profundus]|uniref:phage/plasmid replication domain-containing protein n=1 Tax=Oceanobacillus profundus TaxID=372463 RepID=UPI003633A3CE
MIHTFELLIYVSGEDIQLLFSKYGIRVNKYRYIRAAIEELNKKLKNVFPAYAIVRTREHEHLDGIWYLKFKVDAVKVLNRGTIKEEDYELIELDIRKFLTRHFGLDYFDYHTLTRIDYRIDVEVLNPQHRELLFRLLEKLAVKFAYKEKIKYGKDENGKPLKYETSQYHKCMSTELIIYSKEDERIAKGEQIQPYDKNIVRYELRLKNSHLNSMKREDKGGKGRPKQLKTYFSNQLMEEYMKKHVIPIVHTGDFYKINEAEKIIANSSFSKRKKESLRKFLITISKGNIDTPLKKTKEEGGISKPTHRQYLRDLASLGINPILIPKNFSTENYTSFPSFLKNPFSI